jgi:hypothetical protein
LRRQTILESRKGRNTRKKPTEIEGIGPSYSGKLQGVGVDSIEDLLEKGSAPKGRKELSEKTGIGESQILRWVNWLLYLGTAN